MMEPTPRHWHHLFPIWGLFKDVTRELSPQGQAELVDWETLDNGPLFRICKCDGRFVARSREKIMDIEEGANVIIRFRTGWELRGEVRIVGAAGICIFDPALKEKLWVPKEEITQIRDLSAAS